MTRSVVTGSSTGIGYATALTLAEAGHSVVATMRDPDRCDLATVAKERDLDVEVVALDVVDDAAVADVFAEVLAAGAVDVLVNNAGIGDGSVVEETDLEIFRQVMETNFFGALRCTKAVLPGMRERGSGWVVNVTSQGGRIALPGMGAYCGSKFALEAVSESLSIELEPFGVRVAIIEPGAIMTAIWGKVDMTPPTGPYAPVRMRLGQAVITDLAQASSADEVAACILEAITTTEPRLRWLVGQGAERNVAVRSSLTDGEFNALWNGPVDEFMRVLFADASS